MENQILNNQQLSFGDIFSYAPSLESTEIVKIQDQYDLFIGGKWIRSRKPHFFPTFNPATGNKLAEITQACDEDVNLAVLSAKKALSNWKQLSGLRRGQILFRIARIIQERARELAILETLDNGKPIKESRDFDIPQAAAHFFYHAGWADKLDMILPGNSADNSPEPHGVVAQIIPWNFPLLMAAWKIAPALACGNTVVIKPAETTSLSLLKMVEIFQEAGVPDGVINVITGDGVVGNALINHPDVNKIAFTGSTEVGKLISKSIASTDKSLTLELGGKSAHIVFEDAAIDQALEGVIQGIYFNQGHVCCAGSRLLLEESIATQFIEKMKDRMQTIRVGNPLDKNTDLGAIHSEKEFEKIQRLIKIGQSEGGHFFEPSSEIPQTGNFIRPCFFEKISSSFSLNRIEVFGPVLTIATFRTAAEAIQKANDTQYGLAAGIWSDKGSKIHKVAHELKAGVIWANTYNKFDPTSPFGGFFESGYGREGGRQGLLSYLKL